MEEMAKVTALIDSQQKRHKRHPIHKRKGSDRLDGDQQLLALRDLYDREGDSGQSVSQSGDQSAERCHHSRDALRCVVTPGADNHKSSNNGSFAAVRALIMVPPSPTN